ncbi:MAG: hypothetical protein QM723_36650 [Myxococcaceae bacterium]
MKRLVVLVPLLFSLWARAETEQEKQAREDLERQLKSLVGTPPTKIKVNFEALDEGNFKLLEAAFELDGHTLAVGNLAELAKDGTHMIFFGDVAPGPHKIESHVTYQDASSFMMSNEAGFKWKVGSSVSFSTQPGIEVDVNVTPVFDAKADDVKKKLKLTSPAKVVMLAQLDDGKMPDRMERPKVAVAEVPDAGTTGGAEVVKGEKPKTKAELAAEAAEAKRKAKEEALAAKKAAAEEAKQKAEEARQARLAAAEEKRRAAEEARQAKLAAARNAGNSGKPVLVAANGATAGAEAAAPAVVDAGAPEPVDAGPAVAEVVDAGPAVPEVAKVKPVVAPPAPVPEEGGIPLPVIIGIGVAVLGIIIFFATRKKNPQA